MPEDIGSALLDNSAQGTHVSLAAKTSKGFWSAVIGARQSRPVLDTVAVRTWKI